MKYNAQDNIWYCTNAQRLATSASILADSSQDTAKYYEVDTKIAYVVYGGVWYAI